MGDAMSGSPALTIPRADEALRDLAARDPELPDLPLVLGAERRNASLGFSTVLERLRYKPGASVVAALRADDGSRLWVVSYSDPVKLNKTVRRAERVGAATLPLSARTLAGPAHADRLLSKTVTRLFGQQAPVFGGADLVRYNPLRRLVLREGSRALKITASAQTRAPAVARALAGRGLPLIVPEHVVGNCWASSWWGDGDLSFKGGAGPAHQAGAALAGIHGAPCEQVELPVLDAAAIARTAAAAITTLLPALAERVEALSTRLSGLGEGSSPVLAHGDWSADQALTDGREVRIIDLDRATLAPREYDLGTYLACGGDPALLEGYREAGGCIDDGTLPGWQALAHFQRAAEPFLHGDAVWPHGIERAIARAEEVSRP